MANRGRTFRGRGISETQRRKKAWVDMNTLLVQGADVSGGTLTPPDLLAVGESLTLIQFPSQPGFAESTLLRVRGNLSVPKSDYSAGAGGLTFAFGIGVVSDVSAEALAVPNPATASGYDWDGWLFLRQASTTPLEPTAEIVDVKSMRKWKSGDSIVFVAGMTTLNNGGAVGQAFSFSLRGLFLLP